MSCNSITFYDKHDGPVNTLKPARARAEECCRCVCVWGGDLDGLLGLNASYLNKGHVNRHVVTLQWHVVSFHQALSALKRLMAKKKKKNWQRLSRLSVLKPKLNMSESRPLTHEMSGREAFPGCEDAETRWDISVRPRTTNDDMQ